MFLKIAVLILAIASCTGNMWTSDSDDGVTCNDATAQVTSSTPFEGPVTDVSNTLECLQGNERCSSSLAVTKSFTYTYSVTTGYSITSGEVWKGVKIAFDRKFGESWASGTSTGQTHTCFVPPNTSVRLQVKPKYSREVGVASQYCCNYTYRVFYRLGTGKRIRGTCFTKTAPFVVERPIKSPEGFIQGTFYCRTSRI